MTFVADQDEFDAAVAAEENEIFCESGYWYEINNPPSGLEVILEAGSGITVDGANSAAITNEERIQF